MKEYCADDSVNDFVFYTVNFRNYVDDILILVIIGLFETNKPNV